uniref:propionyl-CoA carboxylase n=1 Tax=Mucochytrium quahogii TaxID=96639 RepID=A0A7S2WD42_9STRA|mmetsp:Transcript_1956/g.3895  ORF Transcript_1956/g.3895 Transcript_1956/m.3895 type:complete len:702 (+) Transcript_1956:150-2255(+)
MMRVGANPSAWMIARSFQVRNMSGTSEKLFSKILIANRGEIACRVMKTAKRLGIKTVAVYSEPDSQAMHVKMADEAYCIGPAASTKSYLNIEKIMDVIKQSGAEAVHPGYGFLSENAVFAEELEANGVAFIGPGSKAIVAMGDKIESKRLAIEAGVSTVPGDSHVVKEDEQIIRIANEIGYPVMIKASAGGGGKGMRIAHNDAEALEGFKLSTEEAKSSFGDDRIFIEKFIVEPRHIEIQLIADSHGNVAALPERECSIQRRNQKVLEESPSPFLDPETRRRMQDEAIQLAKAVDYKSAGTVEFLADQNKNFYFLEMNTRLQVEHPVSELVSGIDLVEQMIRVAAGHTLPQDILDRDRPIRGWAHEARVYAEDPFRGFLPSTGRLTTYEQPEEDIVDGVRVDTGVSQGSEISMFYDPMISKLVTHGKTRDEALDRLALALDNYVIKGLGHNLNFLRDVTRNTKFRSGRINTNFIPEEYPEGFSGVQLTPREEMTMALMAGLLQAYYMETIVSSIEGQTREPDPSGDVIVTLGGGKSYQIHLGHENIKVSDVDGHVLEEFDSNEFGHFDFTIGKTIIRADFGKGEQHVAQLLQRLPQGYRLQYCGAIQDVSVYSPREYELSKHMLPKPEIDTAKWLLSPMPGALISVECNVGDKIYAGQELCIVEAMKMQNVLRAEKDGIVKRVHASAGDTLAVDQEIVEFE